MSIVRRTGTLMAALGLLATAGAVSATAGAEDQAAAFPPTVSPADDTWRPASTGNPRRSMPSIYVDRWTENGVVHARQILSYSNHPDGAPGVQPTMRLEYRDGYSGAWTPALNSAGGNLSDSPTGRFAAVNNIAKTPSGTLVAISAHPVDDAVRNADGTATVPFGRYVSFDHGREWTVTTAYVTLPDLAEKSKGVFFQGITVLPDGRWVAPYYYGQDGNGYRMSVRLIVSQPTSNGSVWTSAGLIGRGQDACPGVPSNITKMTEGYGESTIAQRPDGRLLAVMRCDNWTTDPAHTPSEHVRSYLYTSVSADSTSFSSWSAPAKLTIPATAPGAAGMPSYGVAPKLVQTEPQSSAHPGLILAFGRPGNVLAFNADGYGTSWTTGESTIAGSDRWNNAPANHGDPDGVAPEGRLWVHHGSSGYIGMSWLTYDTAIVVGDNCQADWGCWQYTPPNGTNVYPHGRTYDLWGLTVGY